MTEQPEDMNAFLDALWQQAETSTEMDDMSEEEIQQYLSVQALAYERIIFSNDRPYFDWYNLFLVCYTAHRNDGPQGVVDVLNEINLIVMEAEKVRLNGPKAQETD